MHRVRLAVAGELHIIAGSRYSCVVVRSDELIDYDGAMWTVDLLPSDVMTIVKMFKPGKDDIITLRMDNADDNRVTVTDCSGLFDGRSVTIPAVGGGEDMPDYRRLVFDGLGRKVIARGATEFTGRFLRGFIASAAALSDVLTIEPTGTNAAFVVRVGDQLVGLLQPHRFDDERDRQLTDIRVDWLHRLTPEPADR